MRSESKFTPMAARLRYVSENRKTLAYRALVLFSYIYFLRPEDFIPGLSYVPIGKISGGIALLALIFGTRPKDRAKIPIELKLLALLLLHMLVTIVFAVWHGGAFEFVVNRFSKGVVVAFLIFLAVSKVDEIRKLLLIQSATIALVTVASVLVHHTADGRLLGIQKGILENPNDLAINVAISFPLCLAFLLGSKGAAWRVFWSLSLVFMIYAVIATYSRSGLIALVITCIICFWEFMVKGRYTYLAAAALLIGILGLGAVFATPSYLIRVESIFLGNIQGSQDKGSLEARKQLLVDSLKITMQHPLFGVGPGSFQAVSGTWQPSHNTYTGLSSEAGLPALVLFTAVMGLSLRKTKKLRKLPGYQADENIRLWTSALRAGMAAYMVGAFFATTEYTLFEYFIVGYICVLYKIASAPVDHIEITPKDGKRQLREKKNVSKPKRELVWSR
jgi:O-Antigen ligase